MSSLLLAPDRELTVEGEASARRRQGLIVAARRTDLFRHGAGGRRPIRDGRRRRGMRKRLLKRQ
jgi:hypothetical protein